MRLTLEQHKEGLLAIEKISAVFLDSFKNMLSEIAELYRKKHLLLTKETLLEITILYLGYQLVTTFNGEEEIISWVIAMLKTQVPLAKELTPLFTQKLNRENTEKLRILSQKEGLPIPQSADICHLFFDLIAENRSNILMQKTQNVQNNIDACIDVIKHDTGIIMERYIESTIQSLHCLYPEKLEEGYELLSFVLFKPILLSALILANDNSTLADFSNKTEQYFEGLINFLAMNGTETIH